MSSGPHPAGELLGHYRIVRSLGAGGMGEVFLAQDTQLNRQVALKFLSTLNRAPTQDAALLNEARAASRLDHPHIGTIFGVERTAEGQPFMVMAYYAGQTLGQRIGSQPIGPEECAAIALQIARGLAAAHAQRIVHRDIKPTNIILTQEGTVKLVDFGIAKAIPHENSTRTMSVSGTVAYLSPEQAQGLGVDQRSDLWALGVVMLEMLTAKPVFERESNPATLYAIVHLPPPALPPEVPVPMQAVIYRMLAKVPASRYQSAGEVIRDLTAIGSSSVSSGKLSLYRKLASGAAQAPRRVWLKVAIALAVAVAALLAIVISRDRSFPHLSPHVAALSLNVTGEDQALGDGLMESITSRLSNFQADNPDLWIVPISEVRRRKVTDPNTAHKLLNANLVITGTLSRDGKVIRLLINLIDTNDLRQLGGGEFSTTTGDLSEIANQTVQRIAFLMRLRGSPDPKTNSEAHSSYESYLKAVGYLQRYDHLDNVDHAISLLQEVTASDPQFALGFSSLGEAYRLKSFLTKDQKLLPLAESNVNKALMLDKNLADIHIAMGRVQVSLGRQALALGEYQRALQLEPRNPDAFLGIALTYEDQGRMADAESNFKRSAALRPQYWQGYNELGLFFKRQHRYDQAVEQFKRVIELTPDNMAGYSNLGGTYLDAGRLGEAQAPFEKAIQLSPTYAVYANLGVLYTNQHNYRQAAQAIEHALKLNDRDWQVWQSLGIVYLWLQDSDHAKAAFSRSIPLLESSLAIQSPQSGTIAEYAEMLALCGNADKARQELAAALAMAPNDASVLLSGAIAYGALGDKDKSIAFANKAVSNGLTLAQLTETPDVGWLLSNPKFKAPKY